jgi:hypothetical protein
MASASGEGEESSPTGGNMSNMIKGTAQTVFYPGQMEMYKTVTGKAQSLLASNKLNTNIATTLAQAGYRAASGTRRTDPTLYGAGTDSEGMRRNPMLRRYG